MHDGYSKQKKSVRRENLHTEGLPEGFRLQSSLKGGPDSTLDGGLGHCMLLFIFLPIEMFHGFLKPQCLCVCGAHGGVRCLPPFRLRGDCAGCALGVRQRHCAFQCNRFAFNEQVWFHSPAVAFTCLHG